MERSEAIAVLLTKPGTKLTHSNFSPDEYIYSDGSGNVYDEANLLFEDWENNGYSPNVTVGHDGLRSRIGGSWEKGWSIIE